MWSHRVAVAFPFFTVVNSPKSRQYCFSGFRALVCVFMCVCEYVFMYFHVNCEKLAHSATMAKTIQVQWSSGNSATPSQPRPTFTHCCCGCCFIFAAAVAAVGVVVVIKQ